MRALREPLLQFLVAGAVLLVAQRWLAPGDEDPRRIEITTQQLQAVTDSFRSVQNRAPDAQETAALVQRWIDDEVLYRQALALGLDRADMIVRRELQQKMRYLLEDTTPVEEPDEAALQEWLAQNAQRYGHPPRLDFQQVFLNRRSDAKRVRAVGTRLQQTASASWTDLGDTLPGGNVWRAQSETDLRRNFGTAFAQQLPALPDGVWSGPLASSLGTHWVRITGRTPFRPATLDEVRQQVLVDVRMARREAANRAALDALRGHYDIRMPEKSS